MPRRRTESGADATRLHRSARFRRQPVVQDPETPQQQYLQERFFSPEMPNQGRKRERPIRLGLGNLPWVEAKRPPDEEAGEEKEDLDRYVRPWIDRYAKSHPTGGNKAAHAFVRRLGELLKADGCELRCSSLRKSCSHTSRSDSGWNLFKWFHVLGVWRISPTSPKCSSRVDPEVPAAAFYFSLPAWDEVPQDTYIYSPFVANQEANRPVDPNTRKDTWNIVINAGEIRRVGAADLACGDLLTWKVAMWGSPRDERLIRSVRRDCRPRRSSVRSGSQMQEGVQLRPEGTKGTELVQEFVRKKALQMEALRGKGRILAFPKNAIRIIDRSNAYLRTRGGKKGLLVNHPPHVIIDEKKYERRFAVYSDEFLVVPPRRMGISGKKQHEGLLKALSLFLVSDFATYYQFFTSPAWGVKRELATIRSLKEVPVPFVGMSDADLAPWVELHSHAIREWKAQRMLFDDLEDIPGLKPSVIDSKLNHLTYSALGLTDQEICLVVDLARVRIELDEGKLGADAVDAPQETELFFYAIAHR